MTHAPQEPTVPAACPDCLSDQLKGPDQPGLGLSYWRCLKCGLVWNPERAPDRNSVRSSTSSRSSQYRNDGAYWKTR